MGKQGHKLKKQIYMNYSFKLKKSQMFEAQKK